MSAKPTVLLVHGFWGDATHWAKVIVELHRRGFESIKAVELPLTSLADDAARTQQMIKQIDGPVLLVGHSYGGAVLSEAGDLPNVVGLVFVAAFAPDKGESLATISAREEGPGGANVAPDSDGYLWINPAKFQESFCQDVDDDEALVMAVTQKAPVGLAYVGEVSIDPAWKNKPSWYLVSAQDRMVAPNVQRWLAGRMAPRKTVEINASHASIASQPGAIVDLIEAAAREV
ncbi:MAG TPA: alpha/beta hydrolase [Pseudonocardiaceae bacterium]|jgi:pimeloyl-ACP methyl ester carboxylesterase|nr:alpha/beta hydrolase [Pseudonocardiaceae bacterium]